MIVSDVRRLPLSLLFAGSSRLRRGAACGLVCFLMLAPALATSRFAPAMAHGGTQAGVLVCPMHPEVTSNTPGTCPKCGMTLVKRDAPAVDAYEVELRATPEKPPAGQPFELRFTVRAPKTRAIVKNFAVVHERPYHVFLLSQDLEHYEHLHPVQQTDGSYTMKVTLPREGYYKIFSDFMPRGGRPQVIASPLVTAGATGDVSSAMAHLVPDTAFKKTVDSLAVTLDLPDGGLVAGRPENLRFQLADAKTGAPIRNLQPYLGAFGHTLILSEDTEDYVHAHPEGKAVGGGGPSLTFHALFPRAGRYRVWTQFKRAGVISTTVYTVAVNGPSASAASDSRR